MASRSPGPGGERPAEPLGAFVWAGFALLVAASTSGGCGGRLLAAIGRWSAPGPGGSGRFRLLLEGLGRCGRPRWDGPLGGPAAALRRGAPLSSSIILWGGQVVHRLGLRCQGPPSSSAVVFVLERRLEEQVEGGVPLHGARGRGCWGAQPEARAHWPQRDVSCTGPPGGAVDDPGSGDCVRGARSRWRALPGLLSRWPTVPQQQHLRPKGAGRWDNPNPRRGGLPARALPLPPGETAPGFPFLAHPLSRLQHPSSLQGPCGAWWKNNGQGWGERCPPWLPQARLGALALLRRSRCAPGRASSGRAARPGGG